MTGTHPSPYRGRLALTGWALLLTVLYGFGVALLALTVAGLPLVLAVGWGCRSPSPRCG